MPGVRGGAGGYYLLTHIKGQYGVSRGYQGIIHPPTPHPRERLVPIVVPSWLYSHASSFQCRYSMGGGRPYRPTYGFMLRTPTCKIPLWSWRRATVPTPADLNTIYLCPNDNLTAIILTLPYVNRGRSKNGDN